MQASQDSPSHLPEQKKRVSWIALALFAGALVLAFAGLGKIAGAQSRNADDLEPVSTRPDSDDMPVKWLPDLRVLAGAPATTIDLEESVRQLCEEGRLGDGVSVDDVELSIVSGNEDCADLFVSGRRLTVAWKPDAVGKATIVVKAALKDNAEERAFISFRLESWLPDYLSILMIVLGGGGLFLLGMKRMSEGLQAIAGQRLRSMISLFTNNRFLAIFVGFVVTTLVQSSTATSVMALGFVNGGLMTLQQAIGVLMGANIGTTTTGWLFTLNVGQFGLPILGVAAIFYLFCKNDRIRNFSILALGLGMIFFGLETLKEGLAPLPDTPQFSALINAFRADSMRGAWMCVLIGCLATVIAHSSAATLAVTMTLASLGALDLNSSAAIVLGSNVGTSLTPIIVAIGAPSATRRAAYFHVLFNALGVLWVMAIFFPVLIPSVNALGESFHLDVAGKIALTHSLFNIANTIVFLPLVGPIARLLERFVVDKKTSDSFARTGLDEFLDSQPAIAIERAQIVIQNMFLDCVQIADDLKVMPDEHFENRKRVDAAFELERKIDDVQDETIDFITRLIAHAQTADVAPTGRVQIRVVEELEEISDYLVSILKSNLKLKENGQEAPQLLHDIYDEHIGYVRDTLAWLEKRFREHRVQNIAKEMVERRNQYVQRAKEARNDYFKSLTNDQLHPLVVVAIDSQLNSWRRIYEHLLNIAEVL